MTLSAQTVSALARRPWPGNIRQLLSQLRVLMALADDGDTVTPADLPGEPLHSVEPLQLTNDTVSEEHLAIQDALGNMSLAAKKLGISRSTLYRRLEKHQTAD
jgi:transcriptional regulator of acetoin/glycerol metabolism